MRFIFLLVVLLISGLSMAQVRILPSGAREEYFEQAPDYPAGRDSLLRFVQGSIHYPDSAIMLHQQGAVYVSFVVHTDGTLSDIHVKAKSIPLAREARRIAGLLPAFIPARAHGRPVEATYMMPVVFVLPTGTTSPLPLVNQQKK